MRTKTLAVCAAVLAAGAVSSMAQSNVYSQNIVGYANIRIAPGNGFYANPFNHPTSWLSTNEFQYHPKSFDWVEEYNELVRLERTPDMFKHVTVGNDVWTGHNVNVMAGITIGDGAVIGAASVVTRNVGAGQIATGNPARARQR